MLRYMILGSKSVSVIVALVLTALSGLVIVQVLLLGNAMELKEQAFRSNVMTTMGRISASLATHEAVEIAFHTIGDNVTGVPTQLTATITTGDKQSFDVKKLFKKEIYKDFESKVSIKGVTPTHVIKIIEENGVVDTFLMDSMAFSEQGNPHISKFEILDSNMYWQYISDSGKGHLIATVFKGLLGAERKPIEERLDSINVDSVISTHLIESGITLEYAYGVIDEMSDSLRLVHPEKYRTDLKQSEFLVSLFPQDMFATPSSLVLFFPEHNSFLWSQMSPLLAATILFMLIIMSCFMYTIMTIIRQRRVSQSLIDFINNMTHEFKTPISTISLASEAIERPEVLNTSERVLHFNEMIKNENFRMRQQTDKILQMATLEEGDQDLNLSKVDLHKVIRNAIKSVSLHVEGRGGIVSSELEATSCKIDADRVHLTNVIYNLLDNANKYSPNTPQIVVRTFDSDNGVGVRIIDSGIGLRPEERKQVFDKYYRVSSGNVHNVKGFGLGLSYVKLIVEAHGATIMISSKYGEGTEVEMVFPLSKEESN